MGLSSRRSKAEMIADITAALREYEEYKKAKIDKYKRIQQLGQKGKEGTTYLVHDQEGHEYAMKTFRPSKSSRTLHAEYRLQKRAYKCGVAPKVYDYDTVGKWILMEKMDEHLIDWMGRNGNILRRKDQKRILEILDKLDEAKVFHNDCNLTNFMLKNGTIYLIDYGFARKITPELCHKLKTDRPNAKLMSIGLVLKLRERNAPIKSYQYILQTISVEDRLKYGLESISVDKDAVVESQIRED